MLGAGVGVQGPGLVSRCWSEDAGAAGRWGDAREPQPKDWEALVGGESIRASEWLTGFVFNRGHTASGVVLHFWGLQEGRGGEVLEGHLGICHGDAGEGCGPQTRQHGGLDRRGPRGRVGRLAS